MARRIDAGLARKTVALLRAQGLPVEAVLARAGLDSATLSRKGARIPFAAHVALQEHAAAAARDPCFGLHLGAALHPRDLGLVGYLGANAATLGDVLYVAGKYLPLLTEGTRVEIDTVGEHVRVAQHLLDPAGAGSRQLADLGASSLVRVARLVTGTMPRPGSSCRSTVVTRPSTGACSGHQLAWASRAPPSCWKSDSSRCAPSAPTPGCSISWSRSAASGWERCPTGGISALGRRT